MSEVEVRKRVAAEQALAEAEKRLQQQDGSRSSSSHRGEGEDAGAAEGEGEREGMAALILKEQLSGLRDLKPAFHETYGATTTEFKVRPSILHHRVPLCLLRCGPAAAHTHPSLHQPPPQHNTTQHRSAAART